MANQREQIRALVDELLAVSPPGTFGPEPPDMTPEVAAKLHQLGALCRDYGSRERRNRFNRQAKAEGRRVDRAELLDEDVEDRLQDALDAAFQLRTCPTDRVDHFRGLLHSALEQAGGAASDPEHRKDAGVSRESRPRTREVLAMRRGDVEEMRKLRDDVSRSAAQAEEFRGQVERAQQLLAVVEQELAESKADLARARGLSSDPPGITNPKEPK